MTRTPFFSNNEELSQKIDEYLKTTGQQIKTLPDGTPVYNLKGEPVIVNIPPTVAGLAYFLGFVSRQSIYDYKNRNEVYSYTINRAILHIEGYNEGQLTCNPKPMGAMFWLKNHGWKDESVIEQKSSVQILDNIPIDSDVPADN